MREALSSPLHTHLHDTVLHAQGQSVHKQLKSILAQPANHYERQIPSRFPAEALNDFICAVKITGAQDEESARRQEQAADYVLPLTLDVEASLHPSCLT
jgi:hypothetical protein